jgi:putative endonuclease
MPDYYVYIMTNQSRTLYTGVTNDLERRVCEHKQRLVPGFTAKYNINMLVWYETFANVGEAIEGEKRIKGWSRSKKLALIEANNPHWEDLSERWYGRLSEPRVAGEAKEVRRLPGNPDSSLRSE